MPSSPKWNPWDQSKQEAPAAINKHNTMSGPPCALCVFWKPQVQFMHTGNGYVYDGIRCCHSREMHHDFSCFKDSEA